MRDGVLEWVRIAWWSLTRRRQAIDSPQDVEDPASWRSIDYVHDQVLAKLELQSHLFDSVEARLRLILGVIGIIFAAALGFQRGAMQIPFMAGAFAVSAICRYLVAGAIVGRAYWPTSFDRPPEPSRLRDQMLLLDQRRSKLSVIDSAIEAYNRNERVIAKKVVAFKLAFALTALATALMGFGIVAQVACLTSQPAWWLWSATGC